LVPEGASSIALLARAMAMVRDVGWQVGNVDATIVAQRPRLAEHIVAMRTAIADVLGSALGSVSIKATTEDGMGYTGSGQGMAAIAVASLESVVPGPIS
jgi:2-C-methyl-D-erythritol 2,4-cyclodiphosphate synthase